MRHAAPAIRFDLTSGWEQLEGWLAARYGPPPSNQPATEPTSPLRPLDACLALAKQHGATLAFVEGEYIDPDYTNEFINFYATTYRPLADRCQRLHFFAGEDSEYPYLGYIVLRPLATAPVGRTTLRPPDADFAHVSCRAKITARAYGEQYEVEGFPFMEQDAQYGVCAHVSIWMVALYHHLVHQTPRVHMSDIWAGAHKRASLWQVSPSGGLSEEQVHAALEAIGLHPIPGNVDQMLRAGQSPEAFACRYLNSRFPVVLTFEGHVNVLIGYGRDTNGDMFFIHGDESRGPYMRTYRDDDPLGRWSYLFVPMPSQIYLAGTDAENEARLALDGLLKLNNENLWRQLTDNGRENLRLRSYLTRGGRYKTRLIERGVDAGIARAHSVVGTSHWIWVTELQDRALAARGSECVIGEMAIDATSHPTDPNRLFAHLPGATFLWHDDGKPADVTPAAADYEPYLSGCAIHDAPFATPLPRVTSRLARTTTRLRVRRRAGLRPGP